MPHVLSKYLVKTIIHGTQDNYHSSVTILAESREAAAESAARVAARLGELTSLPVSYTFRKSRKS